MGYLIYIFVAIGLHILHSQTPTVLFSSSGEKSVDQLTCIFIYYREGSKTIQLRAYHNDNFTDKLSFLLLFWPQEGFRYGMEEGWPVEWGSPPPSVPVFLSTREAEAVFLWGLNDRLRRKVSTFRELPCTHTWGEHRTYVLCEEGYPGEPDRPVW